MTSDVGRTNLFQLFRSAKLLAKLPLFRAVNLDLPDHAFENVVHNEMALHYHQQKSHMSPAKLTELEFILTLLQVRNKEYKSLKIATL